nr:MAG TPA: hypothetical protein [Caudoviricetes sp.]
MYLRVLLFVNVMVAFLTVKNNSADRKCAKKPVRHAKNIFRNDIVCLKALIYDGRGRERRKASLKSRIICAS